MKKVIAMRLVVMTVIVGACAELTAVELWLAKALDLRIYGMAYAEYVRQWWSVWWHAVPIVAALILAAALFAKEVIPMKK